MPKQKHIAIAYDKRGHVICVCRNSYTKTHTRQAEWARKAGEKDKIFLHAEIRALLKAEALGKAVDSMHVIRLNRLGEPRNSQPCKTCMLALKEFNVKKVTHT